MKRIERKIGICTFNFVLVAVLPVVWLLGAGSAFGQGPANGTPEARTLELEDLLNSVEGVAKEPARVFKTADGYMRFVGAPPSTHFAVEPAKHRTSREAAKAFLEQWRNLFVNKSPPIGFDTVRVTTSDSRSYVRYQQTYAGLDVVGAEMIVQVNAAGGIVAVISDIMRDTEALDLGEVSLNPSVDALTAQEKTIEWLAKQHEGLVFEATPATLMIFSPAVVGDSGPAQLVWQTEAGNVGELFVKENVFVDAHSGEIAFHYPLIYDAKYREIYDYEQGGALVREEEDPPTEIDDVDNAYDYAGDFYDFYDSEHGRDSIDDNGMTLKAKVRGEFLNAHWYSSGYTDYGNGLVADDIVGHEFTHGVTDYESDLIYSDQSGAINEALSDMWGEWIDQTNGRGTDTTAVKWLCVEDADWEYLHDTWPNDVPSGMVAIRDMKDPTRDVGDGIWQGGQPDRMSDYVEYGDVHTNSGIGNKLAYLLTDGSGDEPDGKFNGHTVEALGVPKTADLFYECQTNLLTSASDYYDLYCQLIQAAINLNMSQEERDNIEQGCRAVEIFPTLVGWWKLDETSGVTAHDSSGYDNDGTLADSPFDPAWLDDPDRGWCLDFDVDVDEIDYVSLSPIGALATDTVTISAWIKADDLSDGYQSILIQYNASLEGYYFCVKNDRPALYLEGSEAVSNEPIDEGDWYHIAGTYDGSDLKIYVDGELKDTESVGGLVGVHHNAYIGWNFDGKINDVRVYNYVLDMFEIWDAMSGELPRFRVKNSSGETVAWFDSFGNLILKGSLEENSDFDPPTGHDEFRVQDSSGDVAVIDTTNGNMYIKGEKHEDAVMSGLSPEGFIIKNSIGDVVAYIDDSGPSTELGHLYLKGKLYQNP